MQTPRLPFRLGTSLGFILFCLAAQAQQLPMASIQAMPDGDATLFDGAWSIMRPGGSDTNLTCHLPTSLIADGTDALTYRDIGGQEIGFNVSDAGDNTLWDGSDPQTAVWTGPNSFILYAHRPDGSLDPGNAMLYERCETFARRSYEGAVAGDLAPFSGRWSEALPSKRAGQPPEPVSTCEAPTTYEVVDATTLRLTTSDGETQIIPVAVDGDMTIFPNEGYPAAVIWVTPDRWHLHLAGMDRTPDWNLPIILERCPEN